MLDHHLDIYENDRVAVLTFNRPDALNALNGKTLEELDSALDMLSKDTVSKVLILTGTGKKSFVAGADIKEMSSFSQSEAANYSNSGIELFNSIDNFINFILF